MDKIQFQSAKETKKKFKNLKRTKRAFVCVIGVSSLLFIVVLGITLIVLPVAALKKVYVNPSKVLIYRHEGDIDVDGDTRDYILYVGKNVEDLPAGSKVPLLFGLHGGGFDAKNFERNYGFKDVADEKDAIVVFPEGKCLSNFPNRCGWNSGHFFVEEHPDVDDVAFLDELVDLMFSASPPWNSVHETGWGLDVVVDPERFYMVGHSNGAAMTYTYAANLQNTAHRVRKIAPISGTVGGKKNNDAISCNLTSLETCLYLPYPQNEEYEGVPARPKRWPYAPPGLRYYDYDVLHVHGVEDSIVPIHNPWMNYTNYPDPSTHPDRYDMPMEYSLDYWLYENYCDETTVQEAIDNGHVWTDQDCYRNGVYHCILKKYSSCQEDYSGPWFPGPPFRVRSLTFPEGGHLFGNLDDFVRKILYSKTGFAEGMDNLSFLIWHLLDEYDED